jgi:hypothetical protein
MLSSPAPPAVVANTSANPIFDAYHSWLAIPTDDQPPHHYRLLGIDLFEDDRDVVTNAADRQARHVRTFQLGPHTAACEQLLSEIFAAKICLLNPARRTAYDQQLKSKLASPVQSVTPRPATLRDRLHKNSFTVWQITKILLGGIAGVLLALLILWFGFGVDLMGIMPAPQRRLTQAAPPPQTKASEPAAAAKAIKAAVKNDAAKKAIQEFDKQSGERDATYQKERATIENAYQEKITILDDQYAVNFARAKEQLLTRLKQAGDEEAKQGLAGLPQAQAIKDAINTFEKLAPAPPVPRTANELQAEIDRLKRELARATPKGKSDPMELALGNWLCIFSDGRQGSYTFFPNGKVACVSQEKEQLKGSYSVNAKGDFLVQWPSTIDTHIERWSFLDAVSAFVENYSPLSRFERGEHAIEMGRAQKTLQGLPDDRKCWKHDRGQFALVEPGVWEEQSPNGNQYRYREVHRTEDYVEIDALTGETRLRIRLYDSRCDWAVKPELVFTTTFSGKWK